MSSSAKNVLTVVISSRSWQRMADAGSERRAELDRRMKERQAAIVTTAPSASTVETAAFTTRFRTARDGLSLFLVLCFTITLTDDDHRDSAAD